MNLKPVIWIYALWYASVVKGHVTLRIADMDLNIWKTHPEEEKSHFKLMPETDLGLRCLHLRK